MALLSSISSRKRRLFATNVSPNSALESDSGLEPLGPLEPLVVVPVAVLPSALDPLALLARDSLVAVVPMLSPAPTSAQSVEWRRSEDGALLLSAYLAPSGAGAARASKGQGEYKALGI